MTSAEIQGELRAARPVAPLALRERVAAIAASTPPPQPSVLGRLLPRRRRALLVALPVAATLAVASAGVLGFVEGADRPDTTLAARDAATPPTAAEGAADAGTARAQLEKAAGAGAAQTPGPTTGRAQRVSANLTIEVPDTDALSSATQSALRTIRSLGGYVVTVSYATSADGTATLTARVPTDRVQDAVTRLSGLGTIVAQQVQIDDLQESIDALTRRIAGLQERIARITAQLESGDLDEQERATLTSRRAAARAELAALRGERAGQTAEARLATVQLALVTDASSAVPPASSRIDRGIDNVVEILELEATVLLYALVVAGPFLLAGLGVWWGRRMLQRRGDERLLGAS